MKKRIAKKKVIVWAAILLVLILAAANRSWYLYRKYAIGPVGKNIIHAIDSRADASGNCSIDLSEMTDFAWDTLVVFDADFAVYYGDYKSDYDLADAKMSEILGFAYERMPGYRSRLIFVKDGQLVHEESYLVDIEAPSKMNIAISPEYSYEGMDACCVLSADEAKIAASREAYGSKITYYLNFPELE